MGDVGADGLPVCDEFACRTWGCWCDRAPEPECEHGNHPRDCAGCDADDQSMVDLGGGMVVPLAELMDDEP